MGRTHGTIELPFIKGHMGGNTILLLPGVEGEDSFLVKMALNLLEKKNLSCHQAGFLYPGSRGGTLKVRIVGYSTKWFISACGGLTQVLGLAFKEGLLDQVFGLSVFDKEEEFSLETEAGDVLIRVSENSQGGIRVLTDMTSFVRECHQKGMEPLSIDGQEAFRIGKFLVVNAGDMRRREQKGNFEQFDADALSTLKSLQQRFQKQCETSSCDFSLYDWSPYEEGCIRAVFPHGIESGHVEPACGTGTVAIGLALFASGQLVNHIREDTGTIELDLETGGGPGLSGDESTHLLMHVGNGSVNGALFSHSKVEILARGTVFVRGS
ncbi:MAG: hypothetical protein ACC613_12535 [Synergistales bacterium]